MSSPTIEPSLLDALVAGDPDALDRWYRAEHPVVYRLCLGFLAHRAEADDLAQDAMLHLHDRLERYDRDQPYERWRTTVVLNLCRDRERRLAARRRAEDASETEAPPRTEPETPLGALSRAETRALVVDCLERLTPREREVFVLRDLEGLETDDVAALLDVGASSVRSHLALARRRLRQLLGPRLGVASSE